ncbi:protein-disulfide isomerase [Corynebacterium glutamicum]|uniref:Protein-disulfide isomerase n=1 Tax=Corynebacterium glutamicum TaxID=1718 RepID=A0AB36IFE4_CORGT|nr:protein-disulfide isomerase [Corynebacterium glutamicum]OKX82586.1 protein-disulfide isomerase [Corynebacterium glutamicum]TWS47925.1 protein-disulfide isomerase [Corynebacterium glutamicum]TWS54738.1 protein-disulfide isomerase [Corynebacterium glutamicum]
MVKENSVNQQSKKWLVPTLVVIIAVLLIAVVLLMYRGNASETAEGAAATAPAGSDSGSASGTDSGSGAADSDLTSVEARDPSDPVAVGDVNAPVGLVVFSDYQCPFCAKWSDETLPQMMKHVEDGNLRIEWREVNIFGEPSERGARAAYAAGLQDSYLEYHNALFANGEKPSEELLSKDGLIELAGELGLDVSKFTEDFQSPETAAAIAQHQQLGIDLGAYSTPAFLLGGQPIMGAQPASVFEAAFEQALAAKE